MRETQTCKKELVRIRDSVLLASGQKIENSPTYQLSTPLSPRIYSGILQLLYWIFILFYFRYFLKKKKRTQIGVLEDSI